MSEALGARIVWTALWMLSAKIWQEMGEQERKQINKTANAEQSAPYDFSLWISSPWEVRVINLKGVERIPNYQ